MEKVDLAGLIDRYPEELSGGQKQRVAIARALIKNPKLILADEPTGNLNSTTSSDIMSLLVKLSKERLVVVVTHDKESAILFGDRVIELKDGKILTDKSKSNEPDNLSSQTLLLKNAKFTLKSAVKFVISVLKHKKYKLVASILLSVIAVTMFGIAFTVSIYNTEKQIVKNILKAGVNSIIVSPVPDADVPNFGLDAMWLLDDRKAIPSTMYDYLANYYPAANGVPLYDKVFFYIPFINNNNPFNYIQYTAVVSSADDIMKTFGLKMLDGYHPLDGESVYLTDAIIYILTNVSSDGESAYYIKTAGGETFDLTTQTDLLQLNNTEL